VKYIFRVAAV